MNYTPELWLLIGEKAVLQAFFVGVDCEAGFGILWHLEWELINFQHGELRTD